MRKSPKDRAERGRIQMPGYPVTKKGVMQGAFEFMGPTHWVLLVVVDNGLGIGEGEETTGWEHVSVSHKTRAPNWREMCFVKDQFWKADEVAVEFHPAKENYVNEHPYCLHMWRQVSGEFPMPPLYCV